ncbi:MFS transporter [Kribbella sp. NPDC003557]|uniref:MFS transporter n=1 Tax=Kribbella sp. NPDC003557 TaxID=3154449 RepID=UPI0033B32BBC
MTMPTRRTIGRPPVPADFSGRWRALTVSQLAAFMALLDVSIVNVALPSIERGLDVGAGSAQWVVSGYALAFGLALVPAGRLGDAFGRRRMFMVALAAFVVTSAMTGAAPTIELLIAARILQGVAGGLLIPQNTGLIQELFDGSERGRAFGVLGTTVGLATATGPVVGGLIITVVSAPEAWRWVFYVNVPIGLLALALAVRLLPAGPGGHGRVELDLVGSALLGAGVLSLLLPLVDAESKGFTHDWGLFVVAVFLLASFAWWEGRTVRREKVPVLDPRLAHTPGYVTGSLIGMVYFIGFTGIWLVLALFFQDGLGYSPLRSGLAVTPFALGVATSAAVAGRFVNRLGRVLTVTGLVATTVGLAGTALLLRHHGGDGAAWVVAAPLLVAGVGGGLVTSPNLTLSLENVPVRMAGAAGGALQTAQRVGGAIGTAVLATTFYRILTNSRHDYAITVSDTILFAATLMLAALAIATADLLHAHYSKA